MHDVDAFSRSTPCLCKVAPKGEYLVEDVHRAGGIPAILGELSRAGMLHHTVTSVHADTLEEWLNNWDIRGGLCSAAAEELFRAAPGCRRSAEAFSQSELWDTLDRDEANGCIRSVTHAHSADGGLAVLTGNLAPLGCVVKTAGVAESALVFSGPAVVVESQEEASDAIFGKRVVPGDVVIVRYEGPRGGPDMQEMLYPTAFLKSRGLGALCALITDGRSSGGTSGLSIGHVSPGAAAGGPIAFFRDGDTVVIDISNRSIRLEVDDAELARRRDELEQGAGFAPTDRVRAISPALRAYAAMVTSADRGAVRDVDLLTRPGPGF